MPSIACTALTTRLMRAISCWFDTPFTAGRPAVSSFWRWTPLLRTW
jgi:hypothetical protein